MKITLIGNGSLKEEFLSQGYSGEVDFTSIPDYEKLEPTEVTIDLEFTTEKSRIDLLNKKTSSLIIVNAVTTTLNALPENYVRINGWNGFLDKEYIELSTDEKNEELTKKVFSLFGKKTERVPDIPGFFTARVISMIINEAYFTLEENVSSKKEIDTAMKLGTNYPYGPFEWSEKIGLKKILHLLEILSKEHPRYMPNSLLQKEALTS